MQKKSALAQNFAAYFKCYKNWATLYPDIQILEMKKKRMEGARMDAAPPPLPLDLWLCLGAFCEIAWELKWLPSPWDLKRISMDSCKRTMGEYSSGWDWREKKLDTRKLRSLHKLGRISWKEKPLLLFVLKAHLVHFLILSQKFSLLFLSPLFCIKGTQQAANVNFFLRAAIK